MDMNKIKRTSFFFLIICLTSCSNDSNQNKILELEKRITALEEKNMNINKIEVIQQTIPLLEALPITFDKIRRIEDTLSNIEIPHKP